MLEVLDGVLCVRRVLEGVRRVLEGGGCVLEDARCVLEAARCVLEAVEIVHYTLYVGYVMRCVPKVLGGCAEGEGCSEGA